jgi:hypothetical protein
VEILLIESESRRVSLFRRKKHHAHIAYVLVSKGSYINADLL